MREISFGQYYPADSIVHRLDPRIKLVITVAYVAMIFFIDTFIGFGVAFLFLASMVLLSKIPVTKVLKSVKTVIILIMFTMLMTLFFYSGDPSDLLWSWWVIKIYQEAIFAALKVALRLMFIVMGPAVLTLTTTPVAVTDALERLLKPLTYIKFPVHEMAIIMSIALRLIPTLAEKSDRIISAQKARCADFDSGNLFKRAKALLPILIPLFVSSFTIADELADAMDSRCYRGAVGRTRMKVMKTHFSDYVALFVVAAVFFAIIMLKYRLFGLPFYGYLM